MRTSLLLLLLLTGLHGCAGGPPWPLWGTATPQSPSISTGTYSFDWKLSGHRDVAPLQVFDDGRRTWLQFASGQPVPAIFRYSGQGLQPVSYEREGPYIVLPGVWSMLVLRGGQRSSQVTRVAPEPAAHEPVVSGASAMSDAPAAATTSDTSGLPGGPDASGAVEATIAQPVAVAAMPPPQTMSAAGSAPAGPSTSSAATAAAPSIVELTAASFHAPLPATPSYEVSPRDLTLRAALARWARLAGWAFQPEHWAVDADIPIVGSARFDGDFKHAVRELAASTELGDRPVQPCFYANKVLRIVPYAQPCDRTAGAARPA